MSTEEAVRRKFQKLEDSMDERMTRLWAGAEAEISGYGGVAAAACATSLAISTVQKGRNELRAGAGKDNLVNVRRKGGGRRPHDVVHPELLAALTKLVDPATRGDPTSPLRWTGKSTHALSREMFDAYRIRVSDKTVAKLLRKMRYSLQATHKTVEGKQQPDRNAQFEHINTMAKTALSKAFHFFP